MEIGGIGITAKYSGNATLGPSGRRLLQRTLRKNTHTNTVSGRGADGGGKSGNARTDNK
ncbi:unannotated protein [freshwater metagenome]|uniref:Unannotated protein n=1 Tax=freshwater metagenome TaxID=449393 RepID=A0A6J6HGI8_9ZZZZ